MCIRDRKKGGIVVSQSHSPLYDRDYIRAMHGKMRRSFRHVSLYLAFVPFYPAGCWSFTFASDRNYIPGRKRKKPRYIKTKYYNGAVHEAAFALPEFVEELVEG